MCSWIVGRVRASLLLMACRTQEPLSGLYDNQTQHLSLIIIVQEIENMYCVSMCELEAKVEVWENQKRYGNKSH